MDGGNLQENFGQNSLCLGPDSDSGPRKYNAEMIMDSPQCSVLVSTL
jgi:hypothetical protein